MEAKGAARVLHQRHDALWAGDDKRKCVVCEQVKLLKHFDCIEKTDGKYVLECCWGCLENARRNKALTRKSTSLDNMATALGKAIRRPVAAKNDGPSMAEFATKMMDAMGGMDVAADMVGKLTKQVITNPTTDSRVAIKYMSLITDTLSVLHRNQAEPIDLSQINEEDLLNALMEPAKKLILTDDTFCYQLLSIPEVRRKLLTDMGVDILDVEPTETH